MERRHLEYFLAVIDHGGFIRAAAAIHVTQPALSQAMRQLERELGTELFHRVGRNARPTAAGLAMQAPARQAIRDFSTVRSAVHAVVGLTEGQLDIAMLPTLAQDPGARLLGTFHSRYPGVKLAIRGPDTPRVPGIAEMVRSGDCEIGLTEPGAIPEELAVHTLKEQDYVALIPPGTPVPDDRAMDLPDLLHHGLVVGPWWDTSQLHETIETLAPGLGHQYVVARTQYLESLVPLVASGVGVALVPRYVGDTVRGTDTIVVETRPPIIKRPVLIHRSDRLSPATTAFRDLVLATALSPSPEA